jgi:hypothetical protein
VERARRCRADAAFRARLNRRRARTNVRAADRGASPAVRGSPTSRRAATASIKSAPTTGGTVTTLLSDPTLDQNMTTDGTLLYFTWTSTPMPARTTNPRSSTL